MQRRMKDFVLAGHKRKGREVKGRNCRHLFIEIQNCLQFQDGSGNEFKLSVWRNECFSL